MVLSQPVPNICHWYLSLENLSYNFTVNSCSHSSSQLCINRTVVSVAPHAVRTYIVSRDIALKNSSIQHGVCSLTILYLATRIADYPTWRVFTDDPIFGDEDCRLREENEKQRRENQPNLRLRAQAIKRPENLDEGRRKESKKRRNELAKRPHAR